MFTRYNNIASRVGNRTFIFAHGGHPTSMSSVRDAKRYSAQVTNYEHSTKKQARAAKLRAKAARLRKHVAKHDAKIRKLQRKIAELERRAGQLVGVKK